MEGLRGFAVLLVFFVHYSTQVGPWMPVQGATTRISSALGTNGHAGVDLFFVLSGYLIYGGLISRYQPFLRFIRRRIQRIFPAFIAVFLLYIALSVVYPSQAKIPGTLPHASLFLLENFLLLPGLFPIVAMITVAWSLSYEMFFYLAIPLVITALDLRDWEPQRRVVLFLAVTVLFATYCAVVGGPVQLIMFLSGMLLDRKSVV